VNSLLGEATRAGVALAAVRVVVGSTGAIVALGAVVAEGWRGWRVGVMMFGVAGTGLGGIVPAVGVGLLPGLHAASTPATIRAIVRSAARNAGRRTGRLTARTGRRR
jgi:hypothetical protein